MKKNLKRIMAIILAVMTICAVFAGCKNNKEDEGANPTVNGTTQAEGWSENTTKKKDGEELTSASTSQSTTSSTTKKEGTTAKKETTTKKVTTTKNNSNNNGNRPTVAVTTRPAPKPTTTAPTTQPVKSKPLTEAQKQEWVDEFFNKFPEHGAKPDFKIIKRTDTNWLEPQVKMDQSDYKKWLNMWIDCIDSDANGCTRLEYYWGEEDGKTTLWYRAFKDV